MSQPPYPPPGGSDTGDDRPSARPYPEWQPAERVRLDELTDYDGLI